MERNKRRVVNVMKKYRMSRRGWLKENTSVMDFVRYNIKGKEINENMSISRREWKRKPVTLTPSKMRREQEDGDNTKVWVINTNLQLNMSFIHLCVDYTASLTLSFTNIRTNVYMETVQLYVTVRKSNQQPKALKTKTTEQNDKIMVSASSLSHCL